MRPAVYEAVFSSPRFGFLLIFQCSLIASLPRKWGRLVFNALEVGPVPREQGQAVGRSNAGDQAVAHSDCLTGSVTLTPNFCGMPCGVAVERRHIERIEQLANGVASLALVSATKKLETGDGRSLELFSLDVLSDLILHWLDADQDIRISRDRRQLSRSSLTVLRNSSLPPLKAILPSAPEYPRSPRQLTERIGTSLCNSPAELGMSRERELNSRPPNYESGALPSELPRHSSDCATPGRPIRWIS
jgi:hypothetical protein